MASRMVCAPSSSVSERPRACSSRSVKTWPRSGSPASCTSSIARKSTSTSRGIASTVHTQIARALRLDLLLAGDERDAVGPDARGDLVVDLAREQTQRQADHPALVPEHALDGEVRLAGVGGPEHGRRHGGCELRGRCPFARASSLPSAAMPSKSRGDQELDCRVRGAADDRRDHDRSTCFDGCRPI